MKAFINGRFLKEMGSQQPKPRGIETADSSKPITPEDVHNIVNIVFTLADIGKALWSVIRSWFKKK